MAMGDLTPLNCLLIYELGLYHVFIQVSRETHTHTHTHTDAPKRSILILSDGSISKFKKIKKCSGRPNDITVWTLSCLRIFSLQIMPLWERLGGSVCSASNFGSGHDLTVSVSL